MDALFKALGDETRRKLLDRLRERDGQTLTELEQELGMSRFGVMKHLKVLGEAHLVVTRKSGRFKYHFLNAVPLQEAMDRWIEPLTAKALARAALDLKQTLENGETDMSMDKTLPDYVLETYIKTTPQKLWDALTKPELTRQYYFGAGITGDLKPGGHVDYLRQDGGQMVICDVISVDPPKRLEMTFEPAWETGKSAPSRHVYEIEQVGESCKLTILHFNLPASQTGIRDGWVKIASSLKTLLETGHPIAFAA